MKFPAKKSEPTAIMTPLDYAKNLRMATSEKTMSDPYLEELSPEFLEGVSIERIVKLADGTGIRGTFRGRGGDIEMVAKGDAPPQIVATWRIEMIDGNVARLMDAHQLSQAFTSMSVGTKVRIAKIGTVETRAGRRCADYIIAVERGDVMMTLADTQLALPAVDGSPFTH